MSSPFAFGSTSTSRTTESGRVMWHNMVNTVILSHTVQDSGEKVQWLTRPQWKNSEGRFMKPCSKLKDPPLRYQMSDSRVILLNRFFLMIRSNWFAKRLFHTRRHPTIYSVYKEKRNCEIVFHRSCQFTLHYKQLNFKSGILRLEQLNFNDFTHIIPNHHIA